MQLDHFRFTLTPELMSVLRYLSKDTPRNPLAEKLLWEHPEVVAAAKKLKIKRPDRPSDGRGKKANETAGN